MKNLLRFLAFFLMVGGAYAQSNLPACQGSYASRWSDCFGTYTFGSGNKYIGEWKDGKKNGQGTLTIAGGDKYVGEFKDDKANGQGTLTFANGGKYVGELKDYMRNGQGTLTFANGDKYVGEWKDDRRNGQGTRYASNGSIINQGIWDGGIFVRSVPVQQASTVHQTVTVASAQPNATQSNLPACPSSGYFHNCFGKYTYHDGNDYVGEFKDGKRNGHGAATFADGNKYIGEWKDGKRNGQGTFTFADGAKYVGEFKDDMRNGQGTYTFASGSTLVKYVGELKDNKRNGQGTLTFTNGDKYVGEFKEELRNGQGTLFASNSSVINEGIWANGIFVRPAPVQQANAANQIVAAATQQPNISQSNLPACPSSGRLIYCFGTYTYPSGNKYVGEFSQDKRNGQGIFYSSSGSIISQGIWSYDNLVQPALIQEASVANQTLPAVALQPDSSERDRLLAEVEAERKKRQELEEQLRVAQQSTKPNKQPVTSGIERRVALVIGNSTYRVNPLDNPANDATDITTALNKVGFRTTLIRNATLGQMRDATRKFAEQLQSADVALIYFAGHGIESNRKNYMIPVNADLKFEYELTDQAYDAGSWLEMLETIKSSNSERVNIVILDACRNNNLIGSRSLGRGLGRMDAPTGTFLSYSTAPGKVAADGAKGQRNSPFTRHLLSVIQQPGLQIEEAFKEVRRNVSRDTNGTQVPWESTSLVGKFYFTAQR